MKRVVLTALPLLILSFSFLTLSSKTSAQVDPFGPACQGIPAGQDAPAACSADGNNNPISGENGVILRAISIMSWIVGATAVIMIMFAGLKFITANGDPSSITTARNAIIYTLIGVVIFAISNLIVRFVISRV